MKRCVVLGRFQPFHFGHAGLVEAAAEHAGGGEVVVAVGSAQSGWDANNPWTAEERGAMIEAWAKSANLSVSVVHIEDINDPPRWVEHATKASRIIAWLPRPRPNGKCGRTWLRLLTCIAMIRAAAVRQCGTTRSM